MTGDSDRLTAQPLPAKTKAGAWSRFRESGREDLGRLFRTGVPHLFLTLLGTQGLGIIRRVLLARMLSVGDLGRMTYVMQIADLVAMCADFGICTAVLKFAAEPISDKEKDNIYRTGLLWSSILSSVVALVYFLAVTFLVSSSASMVSTYIMLVTPYIVVQSIVKVPLVFMQARKEIKRAAKFTLLTQGIGLVANVGATWLFGLWGFFITVILSPMLNLGILLGATRSNLGRPKRDVPLLRKLLSFGGLSVFANAAGFANMTLPVLLLKQLTGSDEIVGYFSIAMLVMTGVRFLPSALLQTAFPYLSGLLNDPRTLRKRIQEMSVKQCLIMGIVVLGWLVLGGFAIQIFFGARYASAYWPSTILVGSLLAFAFSSPYSYGMLALNAVGRNGLISAAQACVNALVCYLLIPRMGGLGAAVAIAAAQLVDSCCAIINARIVMRRAIERHDLAQGMIAG